MFKKSKIGDRACTTAFGWGRISNTKYCEDYPILIRSGERKESFTIEGRLYKDKIEAWTEEKCPKELVRENKDMFSNATECWANVYDIYSSSTEFKYETFHTKKRSFGQLKRICR